jgi:hypothetical protein
MTIQGIPSGIPPSLEIDEEDTEPDLHIARSVPIVSDIGLSTATEDCSGEMSPTPSPDAPTGEISPVELGTP